MLVNLDYEYVDKPYEIVSDAETVAGFYQQRDAYTPEEGETILVIVRHGETASNQAKLYAGAMLDDPLAVEGVVQGKKTGEVIKSKISQIDRVVSSSMRRTYETALEILKAFPESEPSLSVDVRLLERNVGKYEGRPLTELDPAHREDKRVSASREYTFEEKMRFSPEVGEIESFADVWKRAHPSLQEMAAENEGKVVLAVTHSGTMRSIYWHLTQDLGFFVPYSNFKPLNGACMIVSAKNGHFTLLETYDIAIISE